MAPEIIELNGATPKSDIWSVGCTIVELLTGAPPYFELQPMPALFRIVQDDLPPIPEGISPALRDFLLNCFQKEPMLRRSAKELLKHRWITSHAKKRAATSSVSTTSPAPDLTSASKADFQAVTRHIEDYNKKLEEKRRDLISSPAKPSKPSSSKSDRRKSGKKSKKSKLSRSQKGRRKKSHVATAKPRRTGSISRGHKKTKSEIVSPSIKKHDLNKWAEADDDWNDFGSSEQEIEEEKKRFTLSLFREEEQDDWDDDFGEDFGDKEEEKEQVTRLIKPTEKVAAPEMNIGNHRNLERFAEEEDEDDFDFDLGSSTSSIDLVSKLQSKINSTWDEKVNGDTSENFDIFDITDEWEEEFDVDETLEKDNYANLTKEVLQLINILQPKEKEEEIFKACDKLILIFKNNPDQKEDIIRHHSAIPIMDMLSVSNVQVIHAILKVVNQVSEKPHCFFFFFFSTHQFQTSLFLRIKRFWRIWHLLVEFPPLFVLPMFLIRLLFETKQQNSFLKCALPQGRQLNF